jgi:CHAT domain-containing protein
VTSLEALGSSQSTTLLGEAASEAHLAEMARSGGLREFDILHFATHALINPWDHKRSILVLSQVLDTQAGEGYAKSDGLISVQEILDEWTLDAELVTLSGCETALGRRVGGEGYLGLSSGMLQVGASGVMVSLWPVSDEATSRMMEAFYRTWLDPAHPKSKREALRAAKLAVRNYEDRGLKLRPYEHPFFWASFVLIGNPD